MTVRLPAYLPAVAMSLVLAGCSSTTDNSTAVTSAQSPPRAAAAKPFVGTIQLLEHRYLLGIRSTDYVVLTFDGPRLRREVRPGGFADSTERYGILADLRTDSVTYYVQDGTRNAHYRLAHPDYLARVAANEPILTSLILKPYSTIFAPPAPRLARPALNRAGRPGPALPSQLPGRLLSAA